MFRKHSDRQIIEDILARGKKREEAWKHIVENWGGYCCMTATQKTGCDESEARQALSIACSGLDNRIKTANDPGFLKFASLKTYLTSATIRAAWHVVNLRKKGPIPEEGAFTTDSGDEVERWFQQKDCREILEKALSGIGERCKRILLLFNDGFGMKEMVREMGFANEDVAKTEKWQCQEKFKTFLRTNPGIRNTIIATCYG